MTKTLYVKRPEIWRDATLSAEREGISIGTLVERAVGMYLALNRRGCPTCEEIRRLLDTR